MRPSSGRVRRGRHCILRISKAWIITSVLVAVGLVDGQQFDGGEAQVVFTKDSGEKREGVRSAREEVTEPKVLVLRAWN